MNWLVLRAVDDSIAALCSGPKFLSLACFVRFETIATYLILSVESNLRSREPG